MKKSFTVDNSYYMDSTTLENKVKRLERKVKLLKNTVEKQKEIIQKLGCMLEAEVEMEINK